MLGLSATPATLIETPKLVDEGERARDARARQGGERPAGNHARRALHASIFWALAAAGGRGWRILRAGRSASPARPELLTRQFEKGRYRLVVVAGGCRGAHGGAAATLHAGADSPAMARIPCRSRRRKSCNGASRRRAARARDPDVWRFSLAGDADVALSISEGMIGRDFAATSESVGKAAAGRDFSRASLAPATIASRRAPLPRRPARLRDFAKIQASCSRARRASSICRRRSNFSLARDASSI